LGADIVSEVLEVSARMTMGLAAKRPSADTAAQAFFIFFIVTYLLGRLNELLLIRHAEDRRVSSDIFGTARPVAHPKEAVSHLGKGTFKMPMEFAWKPELGDGEPNTREILALQKSLNDAYAREKKPDLKTEALNMWVGQSQVIIAAELPGFSDQDIQITVRDRDLSIHAMHTGHPNFDQTLPLPFRPDPKSIKAKYTDGMLFIYIDKPA
jgi:HSP20 family molecular chaperone IbpA